MSNTIQKELIVYNPNAPNYTGVRGKSLLAERLKETIDFCKTVGKNSVSVKGKFPNVQDKQKFNSIADDVIQSCKELPTIQDPNEKGELIDYILGIKKYFTKAKESEDPLRVISRPGTPTMNEPGQMLGGRRRKTLRKTRGRKQRRRRQTKRR
jgi:hypothetical protein